MKKTFDKKIILEAAIGIAREVGFKKLTMRSLASRLGCSVMPIYDAYESKDDLIKEIFNEIIRENNSALTYFERNKQVLLNGIRSPQLYRDVKEYSSSSLELLSHYEETIDLMKKEDKLIRFSYEVHQSINFDLLIYISGIVDRQLFSTDQMKEPEDFWVKLFEEFTEILILGYEQAVILEDCQNEALEKY